MKLLSIVVPCYNSQDYMRRCVDSLLVAGDEIEILIVDDGSTDDTGKIADEYAAAHPDIIRAIHQENGGHGDAVNTGIENATGLFFKVVDSDDWVREVPFRKVLLTLSDLAGSETNLDMLVTNYVYNKVGEKKHKAMRYARYLPVEQVFTWKDVRRFRKGKYILMHSVIFRTKLLRECGLKLPKHTFYVDNLYVYEPLVFVRNMYYLDVNLYDYYIGREDQSVHEDVMISRIDQQIAVNKRMVDFYVDNYSTITSAPKRQHYMYNYLEIVTLVSSVLLIYSGKPEHLEKKRELWDYIRQKSPLLFFKMRYGGLGSLVYIPGKSGRYITIGAYKLANKIYKFN